VWKKEGPQLLKVLHKEIIADMHKRGMDIYSPPDKEEFANLIGKQTLADIPSPDKIRWSMRGVLTSVKILRKSVADSGAAAWLHSLATVLDYVINVGTWLVVMVTFICRYLWSRAVFRAVLVAAIVAVVAIFLWEKSLHDWWVYWLWPKVQWWGSAAGDETST